MIRFILSAVAALATMSAVAQVQLTPLFSDNMVFQQNCQAPVWGKAAPGAEVKVTPSWNNKTYTAVADVEGRWQVKIQTPKGSFKKYTLTISDGEPVVLRNVVVGEVWLASGQSNMEMSFERVGTRVASQDGILNAEKYADVRLLQVSRATGMVEREGYLSLMVVVRYRIGGHQQVVLGRSILVHDEADVRCATVVIIGPIAISIEVDRSIIVNTIWPRAIDLPLAIFLFNRKIILIGSHCESTE